MGISGSQACRDTASLSHNVRATVASGARLALNLLGRLATRTARSIQTSVVTEGGPRSRACLAMCVAWCRLSVQALAGEMLRGPHSASSRPAILHVGCRKQG